MRYQLLKQRGALNDAQWDADALVSEWHSAPSAKLNQLPSTSAEIADRSRPNRFLSSDTGTLSSGNLASLDPSAASVSELLLHLIPESICREHTCFPLQLDDDRLFVATVDGDNLALADKLAFILNKDVRLVETPESQIEAALLRYFGEPSRESVDSMLCEFTETALDFSLVAPPSANVVYRSNQAAGPNRNELRKSLRPALRDDDSDIEHAVRSRSRHFGPQFFLRPRTGMFFYTIPDGTRVMMTRVDGTRTILVGPKRVWKGRSEFYEMTQYIAYPGDYLIVRFRDGHQEHVIGPAEIWHDPRIHDRIERAEGLQISSKEAIVVYSHIGAAEGEKSGQTTRRIVYGPDLFVPQPGEWLHTFSWHASRGGSKGVEKIPNGLVFQKLWLMPDQMYHDVHDVRTSNDAVLTIRLMIFFELVDIALMLDATHDPIGDFVNAATADVVEFTGRFDFEEFKHNTEKLNELATYKQLSSRAKQIGYHIHTVVYRGYGAADSLQLMHNQAIEARTKLLLDRATEQQAQELENFRLESQLSRAAKRRSEQGDEVRHDLDLNVLRSKSEMEVKQAQHAFVREQKLADAKARDEAERLSSAQQQSHLAALRDLGVDLTSYLTQNRADQIFEFRGQATPHIHVDPPSTDNKSS